MRHALVVQTSENSRGYRLSGAGLVGDRWRRGLAKASGEYVNGFAAVGGIGGTYITPVRPYRYRDLHIAVGAGKNSRRIELGLNGKVPRPAAGGVEHHCGATEWGFKRYLEGHRLNAVYVRDVEDRRRHTVKRDA